LKKFDLEIVMRTLKPREVERDAGKDKPKKVEKVGIGFASKPDGDPEGIELRIIRIKKALTDDEMAKEGADWVRAAYITATVAEVARDQCPVDKKEGDKDPAQWKTWSADMKKLSLELAKAAKAKDGKAVAAVATKLNKVCNDCHDPFRP